MEERFLNEVQPLPVHSDAFWFVCSPSPFERRTRTKVMNELDELVVLYLDDVQFFRDRWESHAQHLEVVFGRMQERRLFSRYPNIEGEHEGSCLRFVVVEGIARSPQGESTADWSTVLKDRRQLRKFSGLVGCC